MLRLFTLLLPALLPSWRFFAGVGPSPRVERRVTRTDGTTSDWVDLRPRPERVTLATMARRMLWNPGWNETLFMVSLSERLAEHPTRHSLEELRARAAQGLPEGTASWQFRLSFVEAQGDWLVSEPVFESDVYEAGAR